MKRYIGIYQFYQETVKPAVEEMGYAPIRIDREANEGNIFEIYEERLQDSDIILADITEANPNVMYELGIAHAQNFRTILFSRKKLNESSGLQIPFYLTMDSIENGDATTEEGRKYLAKRIKVHLAKKTPDACS
jgi:nucleoside 2-deoxyribosyltransferase